MLMKVFLNSKHPCYKSHFVSDLSYPVCDCPSSPPEAVCLCQWSQLRDSQGHEESKVASTNTANHCLVIVVDAVGESRSNVCQGLESHGSEDRGVTEGRVCEQGRRSAQAASLHLLGVRAGVHGYS